MRWSSVSHGSAPSNWQVSHTPGETRWRMAAMSKKGCSGMIRPGKAVSSTVPSLWVMLQASPATPSTGCSATKPVRLVLNSVSGSNSTVKTRRRSSSATMSAR